MPTKLLVMINLAKNIKIEAIIAMIKTLSTGNP
jgi:hypothetical protein